MDEIKHIPDTPFRSSVTGKYKLQVQRVTPKYSSYDYELIDADGKEYNAEHKKHYADGDLLRCMVNFKVVNAKLVVTETSICSKQDMAIALPDVFLPISQFKVNTPKTAQASKAAKSRKNKLAKVKVGEKIKSFASVMESRYTTISDAKYAAMKSFAYIYGLRASDCLIDKKQKCLIIRISAKKSFNFNYFTGDSLFNTMLLTLRMEAFRAAMYCYKELCKINKAIIVLDEDIAKKCFILRVNTFPILRVFYKIDSSTQAELLSAQEQIMKGESSCVVNETEATQLGQETVRKFELAEIPCFVRKYSSQPRITHSQRINIAKHPEPFASKSTMSIPQKAPKSVIKHKKCTYGRSLIASEEKSRIPSWLDYDDRFDHDD